MLRALGNVRMYALADGALVLKLINHEYTLEVVTLRRAIQAGGARNNEPAAT